MNWLKENWFKFGIVIGLLIIAISIGNYYLIVMPTLEKEKLEQQKELALGETQKKNSIDAQTNCSKQAKEFFDYFENENSSKSSNEFSNHFNSQKNKCFVLIKDYAQMTLGGELSAGSSKYLYDAIEKKLYGSYSWMSRSNKKYWEVPPLWCEEYANGEKSDLKNCKTEDEFDSFVSEYMGG